MTSKTTIVIGYVPTPVGEAALEAGLEEARAHGDDVVLPSTLFAVSDNDLRVELELPNDALPVLSDYITPGARKTRDGDRVRVTIRVSHYHGLKRLVAGLPGLVTVVAPDEARRVVAEWAGAGAAQYDGDED